MSTETLKEGAATQLVTEAGRKLLEDVQRDESTLAKLAASPGIKFGPQFFEALEFAIRSIERQAAAAAVLDVDRLRQAMRNAGWRVGIHYPQSVVDEYVRLHESEVGR